MTKKTKSNLYDVAIPINEIPFDIPEGWNWLKLGSKIRFEYGKSMPKTKRSGEGFPVYGSNGVVGYHNEFLINGPAIIVGRKGSIGEINWSDENCWPIDTTYYIDADDDLDLKWVYYLLQTLNLKHLNKSTAIPGLNRNDAYDKVVAVPPLETQKQIVAKLESMLGKIHEARELISEAKESFQNRRAAILAKAFRGELTAKWREQNLEVESGLKFANEIIDNISDTKLKKSIDLSNLDEPYELPENWTWVPLKALGTLQRGKSKHRPRNDPKLFDGKYPFIQTGDVARAEEYITEHNQTLSEFGFEQSREFPTDTVCITIAANIADTAILSYPCCFPDSVVGFVPSDKYVRGSKFINYFFETIKNDLEHYAPATAQKNINLKILNEVLVPLPPREELLMIIDLLDKTFKLEQSCTEQIDLDENILLIEKSILSQAFQGQLTSNLSQGAPTD